MRCRSAGGDRSVVDDGTTPGGRVSTHARPRGDAGRIWERLARRSIAGRGARLYRRCDRSPSVEAASGPAAAREGHRRQSKASDGNWIPPSRWSNTRRRSWNVSRSRDSAPAHWRAAPRTPATTRSLSRTLAPPRSRHRRAKGRRRRAADPVRASESRLFRA